MPSFLTAVISGLVASFSIIYLLMLGVTGDYKYRVIQNDSSELK
jgi:hypothetical protein